MDTSVCSALLNFSLFRPDHPQVQIAYFKDLWNVWVTGGRIRTLVEHRGQSCLRCLLGCTCRASKDDLLNYSSCLVLFQFLSHARLGGMGIDILENRRVVPFFLAHGMANSTKLLYRTTNLLRPSWSFENPESQKLLRLLSNPCSVYNTQLIPCHFATA